MTFGKIRELLEAGSYNPVHVEVPQSVSVGHIFDENQTVRWNREMAIAQNEARKAALKKNRVADGNVAWRFQKDLIAAFQEEYAFTEQQAVLIYNQAYEYGHSGGYYEVLSDAEDLADFIKKFLKNEGE